MSDLISRKAVLRGIKAILPDGWHGRLEHRIMRLSTQPRKKGKWIEKSTNGEMFSSCSVCGYIEWDVPRKFCSNCGCQMNGGEDDEID